MSINSNRFKRKNEKIKPIKLSRLCLNSVSPDRNSIGKDRLVLENLDYFIGRKIGSAHFGTVRYAKKGATEQLAVKIIDKAKVSPLFTQKFIMSELDIWPTLHHRHIIQVENILPIQDRIYVFMEFASRGSVIEYVQSHGAIGEDMARSWCRHMAQALRYCHKKGIAHRNLKCDNLLLDKDLQIKIGDFGLCCRSFDSVTGTFFFSETYCGSSSYVAPEIIEGKPYDPMAADVWSAGVCIYVILNSAMPFNDWNITRMHEDQVIGKWEFVPEVQSKLTVAVKKLIKKMLDPVVSTRPTIDEVLNSTWMRSR